MWFLPSASNSCAEVIVVPTVESLCSRSWFLYGVYGIVLDPKFIFSLMKLQAWTLYNRGFKPPCFGAASWALTEGLKV
jgi:hypothetical protein